VTLFDHKFLRGVSISYQKFCKQKAAHNERLQKRCCGAGKQQAIILAPSFACEVIEIFRKKRAFLQKISPPVLRIFPKMPKAWNLGECSPPLNPTALSSYFGEAGRGQGFEVKNNSLKKSSLHQNEFQPVLHVI
jgi:hypothetical protein